MKISQQSINIICIQWGTAYTGQDINRLYSMVYRNTTLPITFHLFSDMEFDDLHQSIVQHPEPGVQMLATNQNLNYRKTVGLCHPDLGGLRGERVFFFDLDVVITGSLDNIFLYPEGNKFYIINDWNTKGDHVGQATCYSFVVGTLDYIKEDFEKNTATIIAEFGTATQQYLSRKVIEKFGPLNFWPDHWFQSFKFHCLPPVLLRMFKTPLKPKKGTKVLAFHGNPNIEDAIVGRWYNPQSAKKANPIKALYKRFKPAGWLKGYWY